MTFAVSPTSFMTRQCGKQPSNRLIILTDRNGRLNNTGKIVNSLLKSKCAEEKILHKNLCKYVK